LPAVSGESDSHGGRSEDESDKAARKGPPPEPPPDRPSRVGRFLQTYSGFLSSFVIGVAGLVATSIWQYRQSQIATEQSHSEQAIARTKAENDWRIARAEILSKNLNVLSLQGPASADQRFGVLLSLTRGSIIDPELAVSYALELGKDNASYMRAVLEATAQKNYNQLAQGFKLTCLQRYGVEKAADICRDDDLAARSDAIAQVFQDELEATATVNANAVASTGPLSILREERDVQAIPGKMAWLFEPYLQDLYERRQWQEIQRFENFSTGARLVGALVLATARTGELISNSEAAVLDRFHGDRRKWLVGYLLGRTCDADCRGKLVDVMLSSYGEAEGDYDEPLRRLLRQPRAEAAPTFGHLHARLLWCQVDADDLALFRDRVLVPALVDALASLAKSEPGKPDPKDQKEQKEKEKEKEKAKPDGTAEDLVDLFALVPEPASTDPAAEGWKQATAALARAGDRLQRVFINRRAASARERSNPPPMIRKVNFCNAGTTYPRAPIEPQ
jgi:hypothetical protein